MNSEWKTWNKLQENGMVSYTNDPHHNLNVGYRKDCVEFVRFCNFKGFILDIGCGPQKIPSYIFEGNKPYTSFVGIDPLMGENPRSFTFVCGLGEYLPFREKLFDQVLFVTSLDHFIDVEVALREAKRVLKGNGKICIWHGEKNGCLAGKTYDWYENLMVPEGAEDRFHYKRLTSDKLESCASNLGLKVIDKETHTVDLWRKNIFIRLGQCEYGNS